MSEMNIDKSKFRFVQQDEKIKDQKFDTKPVGFFKDCLNRFKKNKSSVIAFYIICILLLFSIIAPLTTNHGIKSVSGDEGYYQNLLPRSDWFESLGWDGAKNMKITQAQYDVFNSIAIESGENRRALLKIKGTIVDKEDGTIKYNTRVSSYFKVGYVYETLTDEEYKNLLKYQNDNDVQIIYPMPATYNLNFYQYNAGANLWYKVKADPYASDPNFLTTFNYDYTSTALDAIDTANNYSKNYSNNTLCESNGTALRDSNGNVVPNYLYKEGDLYTNEGGKKIESDYNTITIGSKTYYAQYRVKVQGGYKVRVNYYDYYMYKYGAEPYFFFGTDQFCHDIYTCLGSGARLSFILSISVSLINLIIGFIYGSIEGYYGGACDLIMERISDILASVPFIVVATLFQLHLAEKVGTFVSLLFAFVLTGWIGIAGTVRHQFYRFKNQEYILSARTLGASDFRLIYKHIFPNAMGTIITSCVLIIPGVIFSESILSYLHIVSFKTSSTLTSIGTMLSNGQGTISTYPHVIFFPAFFISLLEISFNLFGNGLRDAFNPSLRGSED